MRHECGHSNYILPTCLVLMYMVHCSTDQSPFSNSLSACLPAIAVRFGSCIIACAPMGTVWTMGVGVCWVEVCMCVCVFRIVCIRLQRILGPVSRRYALRLLPFLGTGGTGTGTVVIVAMHLLGWT